MKKHLIQVTSLSIGHKQPLLENLHFSLESSELLVVLGTNGVGKSTLMMTLLGLQRPLGGKIILGSDNLGLMPQIRPLSDHLPMTSGDFLNLFSWHSLEWKKQILNDLALESYYHRSLTHLSQGMWQRLNLAQALASQPEILFLDEPTQGLDVFWQEKFYEYLAIYAKTYEAGVFCIAHDSLSISRYAHKVLCLDHQPLHAEILEGRRQSAPQKGESFLVYHHQHQPQNCCAGAV